MGKKNQTRRTRKALGHLPDSFNNRENCTRCATGTVWCSLIPFSLHVCVCCCFVCFVCFVCMLVSETQCLTRFLRLVHVMRVQQETCIGYI